ncbi:MAG: hypothetical protein A3B89_02565 [Candidatus Buchananbacteria bacterium RIFCSPHIGHO2_02_FULL_40_13]|uniref:Thioredoxin domain-containing protein n=1 Tax=Candidatus Buchananbacteria bacterium RIFCSPLOWO2_01_FULL_39_33 TaxID=1797543 RepID=A0A1G1YIL6_9BACT|nr:MAG: hypothetical protein A2820_01605 [Candidatus Buchananbacteria bacterium RIFCSPHIGHO2_01_FULL_40_35]OGY49689.1 MAG: hypothetical protein A3B89_02565 [Candidatus Buchananbacteria bacterium RIFCSPHIGHO2_02_FULL_40_13]OGY52139.1 MAG: hypothetical protein A3A02_00840 [Candidatus Buchananbacteria bacterium RIFCSPLOWO2_01_FULL_39_33]
MLENQPINPLNNYNYNQPFPSYKKWYQKKWGLAIIVFIIIVVLLLSLLVISTPGFLKSSASESGLIIDKITAANLLAQTPQRQLAEKLDRPHLGQVNAKLVIVEFSDFQCPVCQAEFPIIREVVSKYQNQILYIYRQYPIINENSALVSQASLCAHEQDKFWAMHDRLFLNPSSEYSTDNLKNIAQQAGLNLEQFNDCLTTEKYKNMVLEDTQDGFTLGIKGTPTFFINGNKLSGLISQDSWEKLLDQLLKY